MTNKQKKQVSVLKREIVKLSNANAKNYKEIRIKQHQIEKLTTKPLSRFDGKCLKVTSYGVTKYVKVLTPFGKKSYTNALIAWIEKGNVQIRKHNISAYDLGDSGARATITVIPEKTFVAVVKRGILGLMKQLK